MSPIVKASQREQGRDVLSTAWPSASPGVLTAKPQKPTQGRVCREGGSALKRNQPRQGGGVLISIFMHNQRTGMDVARSWLGTFQELLGETVREILGVDPKV